MVGEREPRGLAGETGAPLAAELWLDGLRTATTEGEGRARLTQDRWPARP